MSTISLESLDENIQNPETSLRETEDIALDQILRDDITHRVSDSLHFLPQPYQRILFLAMEGLTDPAVSLNHR